MQTEQIEQDNQLPEWAFVEVMGHSKIAGRLSAIKLGVAVMLQVQVMKPDGSGVAYSKMYSPASLFSITPVDQAYCVKWSKTASEYGFKPVPWLPSDEPKQLPAPARSEDFFVWCAESGFPQVAECRQEASAETLREALEAYDKRHDQDDDDDEQTVF